MKKILILFSMITAIMITGCAKPEIVRIFPQEDISRVAIEEIINNKDLTSEEKATLVQMKMAEDIERKKRAVEMEKDNKLSNIINRPVTPLRTPDTILRVLILPYEDDNGVLNGWKYSYVKVDDGKWVMADYLNGSIPSSKMTLTPLKVDNNDNIGSIGMAPVINNGDIKYTVKSVEEDTQAKIKQLIEDKKAAEKAKKQAEKELKKAEKEKAKQEKIKKLQENKNNQVVKEKGIILEDNIKKDYLITEKLDKIDNDNNSDAEYSNKKEIKLNSPMEEQEVKEDIKQPQHDNKNNQDNESVKQNDLKENKSDIIDIQKDNNVKNDNVTDKKEELKNISKDTQKITDIKSDNKNNIKTEPEQSQEIITDSYKIHDNKSTNKHNAEIKVEELQNNDKTNNDNVSNEKNIIKNERPKLFKF